MKLWDIIFKVIILIMGVIVIAFNAQLYIYCKQQRVELNSIKDKQDVEAEFNSNKFKYHEDQIDRLNKDLESLRGQVKEQKDALLQEADKRQQLESEGKNVQASLVDVKAEADAIKQDMKGWQKDYVGVLAQLDKGIDNVQGQIKALHNSLNSLNIPDLNQKIDSLQLEVQKIAHPPANDPINTPPDSEKKIEREHPQSSN